MKGIKYLFAIIGVFISLCSLLHAKELLEEVPPLATIRVLVKKEVEGALLEVKGSYKVFNPCDQKYLSAGFRANRFYLSAQSNGVKWGETFSNIFQIKIVPNNAKTTFVIDGLEYKGSIEAYNVEGNLYIVNETDIESYIKSVLTSRLCDRTFSKEALEAIAVVERTNAYDMAQNPKSKHWHLYAEDRSFKGCSNSSLSRDIDFAVDNTKNMILTYHGSPFPTDLTENCAGTTANYKAVYRKNVSCPEGVEVPLARRHRHNTAWNFKVHKEDLANIAGLHGISAIDLFEEKSTGRCYAIRLKDHTRLKDIDYFSLQEYLGKDKLKSSDFSITLEKEYISFQGFGEGSGTGLCLYTSEQMAKRGDTMPQILADFFPNTRLAEMKTVQDLAYEKFSRVAMIDPNLPELDLPEEEL